MAACQSNQNTAKKTVDEMMYSIYTYKVLKYLNPIWPRVVTYHILYNQIIMHMQSQTLQVYGQDRLAFFENKKPVSSAPVVIVIKVEDAILLVGSFHWVKKDT